MEFEYSWQAAIDKKLKNDIKRMLQSSVEDDSILGFSSFSNEDEYDSFLDGLATDIESQDKYFMKISFDCKIIGMVVLVPNKTSNCSHMVDLTKGYISQKYRGKNGARGAFAAIVDKCELENHHLLTLDVRENTKAHRLWSFFGFEQFGRLEDYSFVDGNSYPGVYLFQSVKKLKLILE